MTAPLPGCRHCLTRVYLTLCDGEWLWVHVGGSFACRIGAGALVVTTYAEPLWQEPAQPAGDDQ